MGISSVTSTSAFVTTSRVERQVSLSPSVCNSILKFIKRITESTKWTSFITIPYIPIRIRWVFLSTICGAFLYSVCSTPVVASVPCTWLSVVLTLLPTHWIHITAFSYIWSMGYASELQKNICTLPNANMQQDQKPKSKPTHLWACFYQDL